MKDKVIIGNKEFETLIAISEEEQAQGLMHRQWPPPIMCFPFKQAEIRKFWMKNTPSPLDIIFCREGKVIDIYQGKPFSYELLGPNSQSDLVVELPLGTASKNNIDVGSPVEIKYSLRTFAKKINII